MHKFRAKISHFEHLSAVIVPPLTLQPLRGLQLRRVASFGGGEMRKHGLLSPCVDLQLRRVASFGGGEMRKQAYSRLARTFATAKVAKKKQKNK